jgi:hypothetical protein
VNHLLQIPPEGILHLFHRDQAVERDYVDKVLGVGYALGGGIGSAQIEVKHDGRECQVYFIPDPDLQVNNRARSLVADLFGWHMVFHGSVCINNLDEDSIVEVMRKVSSD